MGFLKDAISVAAPIVGNMIAPGIGGQIGSAVGSAISGRQMAKQAGETAAQYDARMRQLGQQGFFKPVAMKTLYGQSEFKTDPITGAVTSASYTPSETVQEQQGRLGVLMGQGLTAAEQAVPFAQQYAAPAQGLFSLGQEYLADTPEEARQRYMQQQMDALRPYDIEEEQRLLAMGFGRGTTGLSVGAGGNPMLKALQEGRNRRGLQLAANAEQAAQQQIGFGTQQLGKAAGLMGTGYDTMQASLAPYQSYLSNQANLEKLAQQPLEMGLNVGSTAMTGQQFGSNMAKAGAGVTAQQQLASAERQNEMMQGLFEGDLLTDAGSAIKTGIGKIGGLFGGGSSMIPGGGFGGGQAVPYSSGMSTPGLMFGQRSY
tara:strand:- start:4566 stop:5681 length:1116 start_codon:yes stop_codon:yes gene_type:complete